MPLEDLYSDLTRGSGTQRATSEPRTPYTIANMVSSIDGRASLDGAAGHIGGPADRQLMRILRSRADALMVGAASLRAERMDLSVPEDLLEAAGRPPGYQPLAVVISGSGRVDLRKLAAHRHQRILVVVAADGAPQLQAGQVPEHLLSTLMLPEFADPAPRSPGVPASVPNLRPVLEMLARDHGVRLLLSEGGPSLNHALISHGILDEFFVTLAPKTLAGDPGTSKPLLCGPPVHDASRSHWTPVSIHLAAAENAQDQPDLFLRYARGPTRRRDVGLQTSKAPSFR